MHRTSHPGLLLTRRKPVHCHGVPQMEVRVNYIAVFHYYCYYYCFYYYYYYYYSCYIQKGYRTTSLTLANLILLLWFLKPTEALLCSMFQELQIPGLDHPITALCFMVLHAASCYATCILLTGAETKPKPQFFFLDPQHCLFLVRFFCFIAPKMLWPISLKQTSH